MLTWIIFFIIVGAIIGIVTGGKEGAAKGALAVFASFVVIATSIVLPILFMILLIKACF